MMHTARSHPQMKMDEDLRRLLRASLKEDVGSGDLTTLATVPSRLRGRGEMIAKAPGVLCGTLIANHIFRFADRSIKIEWHSRDGDRVARGETIATLHGRMRGLLIGERVALNFLQRLSGIATLTARFEQAVGGASGPIVCDTRKTTPLWRLLERHAVAVGGGTNHRFGLFDMILIKENHARAAGGLREAIVAAKELADAMTRENRRGLPRVHRPRIAVEARDRVEVEICCAEHVDLILLDNFKPRVAARTIEEFRHCGIPFEISGGVNLKNIGAYARTGADRISIGALTHSAPALDISLQLYRARDDGMRRKR